jgi:hypothetical protein
MKATSPLESAAEFGLTPDEIIEAVTATLDRLPSDTRVRCIDELAGVLAMRLIEKERGICTEAIDPNRGC